MTDLKPTTYHGTRHSLVPLRNGMTWGQVLDLASEALSHEGGDFWHDLCGSSRGQVADYLWEHPSQWSPADEGSGWTFHHEDD